jgi:hypothetical protein
VIDGVGNRDLPQRLTGCDALLGFTGRVRRQLARVGLRALAAFTSEVPFELGEVNKR